MVHWSLYLEDVSKMETDRVWSWKSESSVCQFTTTGFQVEMHEDMARQEYTIDDYTLLAKTRMWNP